ncbi:DUF7344 domain-containing protein [Halobellus marinus]|uniref:DUF7344 domain-containing protein n=1 Tax=Halobellus marinus TaxID=3075123 RepID=UPI003CE58632
MESEYLISVSQLAREVVSIEDDVPLSHATGDAYHNAYTTLIQTHLPKLDSLGAIKYDDDRKQVGPDQNLLAMAMVATTTSPVAQILFHNALSDHDLGGRQS